MKNDLDFLKDKIENSGVQAPGDMDEGYVLKQIENAAPKPVALQQKQKKKFNWKPLAVSAAALVLAVSIGTAVGIRMHQVKVKSHTLEFSGGLTLRQFTSHDEIKATVKKIHADNNRMSLRDYIDAAGDFLYGALDRRTYESAMLQDGYDMETADNFSYAAEDAAGAAGYDIGGESYSGTYTQVEGVDEADIIKTDGKYIYCADNYDSEQIVIFSAAGENTEKVAVIDITQAFKNATVDEAERDDFDYEGYYYGWNHQYVSDIYIKGDRLIALCGDTEASGTYTDILVYDIGDIAHITLLNHHSQSGSYTSSRMLGDMLYTVSSYYVYQGGDYIPVCGTRCGNATPDEIDADCVYALADPKSESFLVVSAYNTVDHTEETESKAILGAAEDIYCNTENLYIYSTRYYEGYANYYQESSQILKVSLTDGLRFTAYAEVDGSIDDQYALDEYNGNLRVATTSADDSGRDVNNLYVLDSELNEIGSVTGFARDESIKAVRYIGDTAYVITYEQTDPLFVIDLSRPTSPEILGEVKISGFSTMLVPVDENTLLGIGYYTAEEDYTDLEVQEGVKLALFDISDKANPQVLDSISYPDCSSEVQYNPKALVYNPERNDYVIPLNYAHYEWSEYHYLYTELYGGMLNFKVENGTIVPIDRYAADYEEDVERCAYVGDTVYMTRHTGYGELSLDTAPYK